MTNTNPLSDITNETPFPIRWIIQGQIRHLMVAAGTYMLAKGILPSGTAEQAFVDWGVNGGLILAGLGWSFLDKKTKSETSTTTESE